MPSAEARTRCRTISMNGWVHAMGPMGRRRMLGPCSVSGLRPDRRLLDQRFG